MTTMRLTETQHAAIRTAVAENFGPMIIETPDDPRPIVRIAHATGIKL